MLGNAVEFVNNTRSIATVACHPSCIDRLWNTAPGISHRVRPTGNQSADPFAEEVCAVDPSHHESDAAAGGSAASERTAAGILAGEAEHRGLSAAEEALITGLIKKGLLSTDQVRAAQVYSQEHNRDLRQSILELNLISPELLNQLAFERLSELASDNGDLSGVGVGGSLATAGTPLSPNRTQHHRDIRKELQEKAVTATLSELVNQILERACDCQATDIHFDPQENGLRVRYRIDGQLQDILFVEPAMATPVISRLKIISNLNIVERRHSQDGRITHPTQQPAARPPAGDLSHDLRREDRDPDPRGADRRIRVLPTWA